MRALLSTTVEPGGASLRVSIVDDDADATIATADVLTADDDLLSLTDLLVRVADRLGVDGYRVVGTGWTVGMDDVGLWMTREVVAR